MLSELQSLEANQAFNKKARNVAVAFKTAGARDQDRNHKHDQSNSQHLLHFSFIAIRYDRPPNFTVRFTVRVHQVSGEAASLYFDIPRRHILALIPTYHVDYATVQALDQNKKLKSMGDITCIRFQLNLPGNLVQPISTEFHLKTASKSILAAMTLLATVSEFDLFMPHAILSNKQINCLRQALNLPMTAEDQLDQEEKTKIWLASLYAGKGGRLVNIHALNISPTIASGNLSGDTSPTTSVFSDLNDSPIPLNFPPAYTCSTVPDDGDPTVVDTNHPTTLSELDDNTPASPPPYKALKLTGKRPYDSASEDFEHLHRNKIPHTDDGKSLLVDVYSQLMGTNSENTQDLKRDDSAKIQDLKNENDLLRAQFSALQTGYEGIITALNTQIANMRKYHEDFRSRQIELENRQAQLENRQSELEEGHGALEIGMEDNIDSLISDKIGKIYADVDHDISQVYQAMSEEVHDQVVEETDNKIAEMMDKIKDDVRTMAEETITGAIEGALEGALKGGIKSIWT